MFVIENRDRLAILLKHFGNFLEELIPRILFLTVLVDRVITMFANDENAIHGQFFTTVP